MVLKGILRKNGYPLKLIDTCVKLFINKIRTVKPVVHTVPKKEVTLILPFLGSVSLNIRTSLQCLFHDKLPHCKLKVIFTARTRLRNFFQFKDSLLECLRSGLAYCFTQSRIHWQD